MSHSSTLVPWPAERVPCLQQREQKHRWQHQASSPKQWQASPFTVLYTANIVQLRNQVGKDDLESRIESKVAAPIASAE